MNIPLNLGLLSRGFKTKRQAFGVGSLIFLLVFGIGFTAAGYFAIRSSIIDPSWQRISGTVVDSSKNVDDSSTTYAAIVSYSVNGMTYQVMSSSGSSFAPTIGDTREVAFNPNQPSQAKVAESPGTTIWLWLFPVIGVFLIILAPILFIRSVNRSRTIRNLRITGQKLSGVIVDVQSMGGNNSTYKIVVAATNNNGVVQNYISDAIGGIGSIAMADFQKNPIPIDVYVDLIDPKRYYVDISEIPNLTPQRISELIHEATNNHIPPANR